jgi:hypothetical protein
VNNQVPGVMIPDLYYPVSHFFYPGGPPFLHVSAIGSILIRSITFKKTVFPRFLPAVPVVIFVKRTWNICPEKKYGTGSSSICCNGHGIERLVL